MASSGAQGNCEDDNYKGLMLWQVLAKISIVLSIIQGLASIVTEV